MPLAGLFLSIVSPFPPPSGMCLWSGPWKHPANTRGVTQTRRHGAAGPKAQPRQERARVSVPSARRARAGAAVCAPFLVWAALPQAQGVPRTQVTG